MNKYSIILNDALSLPAASPEASPAQAAPVREMTRLFGALGDPTRLKLVLALHNGERTTSELAEHLDVSVSAVSHQLRSLKDLDLVRSRREGRHVYHHIADLHVEALIEMAHEHVEERR